MGNNETTIDLWCIKINLVAQLRFYNFCLALTDQRCPVAFFFQALKTTLTWMTRTLHKYLLTLPIAMAILESVSGPRQKNNRRATLNSIVLHYWLQIDTKINSLIKGLPKKWQRPCLMMQKTKLRLLILLKLAFTFFSLIANEYYI